MPVTSNIRQVVSGLRRLDRNVEKELPRILKRVGQITLGAEQRAARDTYKRPVPTNAQLRSGKKQQDAGKKVRVAGGRKNIGKGGKPAWKRSGDLLSQLQVIGTGPTSIEIGPVGSSEAYFGHLKNLPNGALGINRSNDIKGKAETVIEPQVAAVIEQGLKNAISR